MLAALSSMPPADAESKSHQACHKVMALESFRSARAVMLYMPLPGEVDTAELALASWRDGKTVLAPKVSWEQRHMIPMRIHSLDDPFETNEDGGFREPTDGEPWPVDRIDFIIVPALAFDRRGHRLGRGAGFYDRFLARPEVRAVACGLGFGEQLVDELPIHDNDWPVNLLVTDREVLTFDNQPAYEASVSRADGPHGGAR